MKLSTDGVLLGAWAPIEKANKILDVGTGTGVIALMLAQRSRSAHITALEIDNNAAIQAQENVSQSPWEERIEVVCGNFREYQTTETFDLIVSNPPYFVNALQSENEQRNLARHTKELNYEILFEKSTQLLATNGILSIIIPAELETYVIDTAWKYHLYPLQQTQIFSKLNKPCRRVLLCFSTKQGENVCNSLYIESPNGGYSAEYIELTREFYLNM